MGYSYVPLKLKNEVSRIRLASGLTARILQELAAAVSPGVSTMELSEYCGELITKAGAAAALNGYRGFRGNICTSVNHVAAHGVPGGYRLREGDIISLDLTVAFKRMVRRFRSYRRRRQRFRPENRAYRSSIRGYDGRY